MQQCYSSSITIGANISNTNVAIIAKNTKLSMHLASLTAWQAAAARRAARPVAPPGPSGRPVCFGTTSQHKLRCTSINTSVAAFNSVAANKPNVCCFTTNPKLPSVATVAWARMALMLRPAFFLVVAALTKLASEANQPTEGPVTCRRAQ